MSVHEVHVRTRADHPMDVMPDGTAEHVLTARGLGLSPIYQAFPSAVTTTSLISGITRNTNPAERSTNLTTMTRLKETRLNENLPRCRISFGLRASDAAHHASGRIHRNGLAIGTARSTNSVHFVTFSEDFTTGFHINDLIQIFVSTTLAGTAARVNNLNLLYTRAISHISNIELVSPLETIPTAISTTNQDPP